MLIAFVGILRHQERRTVPIPRPKDIKNENLISINFHCLLTSLGKLMARILLNVWQAFETIDHKFMEAYEGDVLTFSLTLKMEDSTVKLKLG